MIAAISKPVPDRIVWPPSELSRGPNRASCYQYPTPIHSLVANAVNGCPCGSVVQFLAAGFKRVGITKSNPFYEAGRLWVYVAGFDEAFQFARVRVLSELPGMASQ